MLLMEEIWGMYETIVDNGIFTISTDAGFLPSTVLLLLLLLLLGIFFIYTHIYYVIFCRPKKLELNKVRINDLAAPPEKVNVLAYLERSVMEDISYPMGWKNRGTVFC